MAKSNPNIPTVNIITQDPVTTLVIEGEVEEIPPAGAAYGGIFSLNCELIRTDISSGTYVNTGTVAVPAWTLDTGGGVTTPALPLNSVQYNNVGLFGGSPNFTWDGVLATFAGDAEIITSYGASGNFFAITNTSNGIGLNVANTGTGDGIRATTNVGGNAIQIPMFITVSGTTNGISISAQGAFGSTGVTGLRINMPSFIANSANALIIETSIGDWTWDSGVVLTTTGNASIIASYTNSNNFLSITNSSAGGAIFINNLGTGNSLQIQSGGVDKVVIDSAGVLTGTTIVSTEVVRLKGYTVATLPVGVQGDTAFVTDALAPVFGVAVAAGGAVIIPVFFDGVAWIVG